jgi:hypothetical protein
MHMLSERLQILVSKEQRRRLVAEAEHRGASVGSLVREAIDARFGVVTEDERIRAVAEIGAMQGTFVEPDKLEQLIDEERLAAMAPPRR